jgi:hypothetical protein
VIQAENDEFNDVSERIGAERKTVNRCENLLRTVRPLYVCLRLPYNQR